MEKVKVHNAEQNALVVELTETYGIKPEEIMFFSDDPTPFLSYEATCKLANRLVNLQDIDIMPVPSVTGDSLSLKCILTRADGTTRGAVGVVNLSETIDGNKMSDTQIYALASSRAIRNTLRTADIDLLQLHRQSMSGEVLDFKVKSNRANLTAHSHQLGKEAGLIRADGNKDAWYQILANRYGVASSSQLTDEQLPDFVAVLKTLVPQGKAAA